MSQASSRTIEAIGTLAADWRVSRNTVDDALSRCRPRGCCFLDAGHFTAHLRRMRAVYEARREALVRACARELPSGVALGPVAGGMNAALLLSGHGSDRAAANAASQRGVRALPLSRDALRTRAWRGLLLGYAALEEATIRDAVSRLARALESSAGGRDNR